jgi:hypothetical protein
MESLRVRLATAAGRFLGRYGALDGASLALGVRGNAGAMVTGQ